MHRDYTLDTHPTGVNRLVRSEVAAGEKRFVANGAFEWLLSRVEPHVFLYVAAVGKP